MSGKIAYLTIDDSPSDSFLWKMEMLYEKQMPAVFFCIGNLLEKYPDEIIEAIKKGFIIANHSYTHPHFSDISLEQAVVEIEKTDQIINQLYTTAKVPRRYKWFRFPYGDKGDKRYGRLLPQPFSWKRLWQKTDWKRKDFIQNTLKEYGYSQPEFPAITYPYMRKAELFDDKDWHWTFDIMEWATFEKKPTFGIADLKKIKERLHMENPPDCRGMIRPQKRWLASDSPEIILLHDHLETDDLFESILNNLLSLPLKFTDYNELP